MSRSFTIAEMKFIDVTALSDASLTTEHNVNEGNLDLFKNEIEQKPYGTLELNQFVLDGSKEIVPVLPEDIAFWSKEKSFSDCTFGRNPVIDVIFSKTHTSSGITLSFIDEYPAELNITWFDLNGIKLTSKVFYPDRLEFICKQQVQNYGRISIEFVKTTFPNRYVKLRHILYGQHIIWEKDIIQKAKVQEEIDHTSATLSINTSEIDILDELNDFDIGNGNGAWKSVQKQQQVTLNEYKDGVEIPAGVFFIDDFSFSDNIASFKMIDMVGLMDKCMFYDGEIYSNVLAGTLLEQLFAAAGIEKYSIDEEVYNTELTGYLGIQTCRAALQMICFACGAVADDSRSDSIKVYKPDRYVKSTIGLDRKFVGNSKIQLDEYVSGVSITCDKYVLESSVTEIYNGNLQAGITRITFTDPYSPSSISVSAGSVVVAKTNYVDVKMDAPGTCIITGKKYGTTKFSYQKSVDVIEAGEVENIKTYGTCTLHNSTLLGDIADRLLSYHALRKKVDLKYLVDREQVGHWANIRDAKGKYATTLIETQSIDLTGGFIATATCRGYSIVVTENFYAGNELYAGRNELL